MSKGIYISPNKFVSFAEIKQSSLKQEIASRSAAWDFSEYIGLLPDPDPVLAKLGDGAEILESLTSDGHLLSVMQSRKLGSLKREIRWTPGVEEGEKPSSQAEQLCKDFAKDLKGINTYDLISSLLDAPYYGMTPVEISWDVEGHLRIKDLQAKPGRWFGFDDTNSPRFRSIEKEEEGEQLPWGKFVFARHFPTYDNPYGLRLLSRCFWPITFKRGSWKFWVTFTEKYGMPFLLGKFPRGSSPQDQQDMLTALQKMVRDAVAAVPEGSSVEMLGGTGKTGGSYLAFERLQKAMDAEVSKVIQGQTLTTEAGDKGSQALGRVHEGVLSVFQESDQRMVKTTLDELAAIYAKVNTAEVLPPTCSYFEEEDPQSDFAARDKTLSETGQLRFTKHYFMRRYDLREDDIEIVDPESDEPENPDTQDHAEQDQSDSFESQTTAASLAQDLVDELADQRAEEGLKTFGTYKRFIDGWLEKQSSLEDAIANVADLFTPHFVNLLSESLMDGLYEADRIGVASVAGSDFIEAVWGTGKPFQEAIDFFKAKSFTIAGHTQADLLAAVKDEMLQTMESGGDIKSFREKVDSIFISHGYDPLSPHRINTLYRTNMQTAFQAGRYTQLTKPHILKARPYWKYVAVKDGSTRPAHAEMNGKIFHHENPVWRTWYPPNGFNCRCQVVSLSEREIKRDGLTVETDDLGGKPFELLNKDTGEIKTFVLNPDEGWGADGGTLSRLIRKQRSGSSGGGAFWKEKNNQSGPEALGRPSQQNIDDNAWKDLTRMERVEDMMSRRGISEEDAFDEVEAMYRKIMGISPLESQGVVRSKDGATITVTMRALAHAMTKRPDARERYIPHMRETLEDPFEILLTEYETPGGKTKYRKKYVGLFRDEKQQAVIITAEIQPDGSYMWNIINAKKQKMDRLRKGVKVLYGQ